MHLRLPPLRKRQEDIEPLSLYFLDEYCKKYQKHIESISPFVLDIFRSYTWPGNIRELRYCIERSSVVCDGDTLTSDCLPDNISMAGRVAHEEPVFAAEDLPSAMSAYRDEYMRKVIINALEKTDGNKVEAAKLLNVSRQTLYNRIKELNIHYEFR